MRASLILLGLGAGPCAGLVVPLAASRPAASLAGVELPRVGDGEQIDLGAALTQTATSEKTLLILGCHAGDFNTVEYVQRCRAFWPQLQAKGVSRCLIAVNGQASSCEKLGELLGLPDGVELLSDPAGEAGRAFGVSRGWRPDDARVPPALKLFVVGIGLGPPWGTLPAVLTGYVGNPGGKREWIEAALKQGQLAGRRAGPLPDILELSASGEVVGNKFDDFPLVGGWGVRPLELATLRLQNLVGIQMAHWEALKPVDDRCLTQLGGCAVVGAGGEPLFSWVDGGLCDVPDFEELLDTL